ncbi:hypothetical protein IFT63_11285 [Stenotrophomonas sp. CFBP 13724]|uniref:hypothetical protein n=1 Tax=Stenotrophomonas sp. CFBP 13724 TaxID=2775298 RepID=UPI001269F35A|nr:hypothetical protein [Stenotrophomonas sp. CFBP 13724]MBD8644166.1 hypothetical protein [Stenotrophomonas sp. CFBP 13724]
MQPIRSDAPSRIATTPHAATMTRTEPRPRSVANLAASAAPALQPALVEGGGDRPLAFVARVADMCREQALSCVLDHIDQGGTQEASVVADALQAVITSLPDGYAWKHLRRDCANAPAPLPFRKVHLDDPTRLLEQAASLRRLSQQVTRAREQGHEREGMSGFTLRAKRVFPRVAAAEAGSDYRALRDEIDVLMHWPSAAIGEVRHALDQDMPVCCHDLWARYNLGQGGHVAGEARLHLWTLLIGGKDNLYALACQGKDPAMFHGPLIQALRQGKPAEAVCEDFHVTHKELREWVHQVAPVLARRQRLDVSHGLPFHLGI